MDRQLAHLIGAWAQSATEILLLPGPDESYAPATEETERILSSRGFRVARATAGKLRSQSTVKATDLLLPAMVLIGEIGNWASMVDGMIFLIRHFLASAAGGRVHVRVARYRSSSSSIDFVELTASGETADVERLVRTTLRRLK